MLWRVIAPTMGIQWAGWALASLLKTEKFYDATGSATFLFLVAREGLANWSTNSVAQNLQSLAVTAWAARLGSFLLRRVLEQGKDRRFNQIKHSPSKFFFAWSMQGVWVIVTLLPTLLMLRKPASALSKLSPRVLIGLGLWVLGFFIEVTADRQKAAFKSDPANAGRWINSGLWAHSRHPNYAGEILLWSGLALSASAALRSPWELALAGLCPLFNYLLIAKLSGVPMLEAYGRKKWGENPDYLDYVRRTPEIFPWPF